VTDTTSWQAQVFFVPPPPDPVFGPGTDLGGAFWTHDPTTRGFVPAHAPGIFICDPSTIDCSIVDHFTFGIGPDVRTTQVPSSVTIPLPLRACASCAACGDAVDIIGPFPFGAPLGPRTGIPPCDFGGPFLVASINPGLRDIIYWGIDGAGMLGNEAFSDTLRSALVDPNTALTW
jgi:hypothetical protein